MTTVSIKSLSKLYPGQTKNAVDNLNLEIASGEITALLGHSGCGKTTLLRMIAGILEPTQGDISFDGKSVLNISAEKRNAVLVFQNHLLFPYMDIASNVGFGLMVQGVAKYQIDSEVKKYLALVHLEGVEKRMPSELSGGQQQRVALARALIVKPKVLLLDEPLSNLDAYLRTEIRKLVVEVQKQTKVTCAFVTHDQQEAVEVSNKIALFLDGKIIQLGATSDFYERPASVHVANFFGAKNIIACQRAGTILTCGFGELTFDRDIGQKDGFAIIRPENIEISNDRQNGLLAAKITSIEYLGVNCRVVVQAGSLELVIVTDAAKRHDLNNGQVIWLNLHSDKVWVVDN